MLLIIASLFSFFLAISCLLVIKRKWLFRFKSKDAEEMWHKKNDKNFKIFLIILFICGGIKLIRGIIEVFQFLKK